MRSLYTDGGRASIVLIAFGAGAIYTGIDGRRVGNDLAREKIVGTPDSTIPGQLVDSGAEAQAFANVIRKHTLEATGGKTYAEMPRFLDANGQGHQRRVGRREGPEDRRSPSPTARATSGSPRPRSRPRCRRRTSPRAWRPSRS